ncbi:MAG: hypothetical protein J6K21_01025, partial [Bacilli bacterium]|nr:hypothetical protein [Bacilli bacterium]
MINRQAKTYNEIIRKKRCYELTKYFYITDEEINEIYDFLSESKENEIRTSNKYINFVKGSNVIKTKEANARINSFDAIVLSSTLFRITPHYTSSSSSGGFSGSSSNNNNNNNN